MKEKRKHDHVYITKRCARWGAAHFSPEPNEGSSLSPSSLFSWIPSCRGATEHRGIHCMVSSSTCAPWPHYHQVLSATTHPSVVLQVRPCLPAVPRCPSTPSHSAVWGSNQQLMAARPRLVVEEIIWGGNGRKEMRQAGNNSSWSVGRGSVWASQIPWFLSRCGNLRRQSTDKSI
jgi:hypothetical protein